MAQYIDSTYCLYGKINYRSHNYKGLVIHSVYSFDISCSYFFKCSSIIPVYKTGNGHLRSSNCQKTLDVGITLPIDIYLYPVAYRIAFYQIGGFIRTGSRRLGSR